MTRTRQCVARRLGRCRRGVLATSRGVLTLRRGLFSRLISCTNRFVTPLRLGTGVISRLSYFVSLTVATGRRRCVHPIISSAYIVSVHRKHRPIVRARVGINRACIPGSICLSASARRILVVAKPGVTKGSTLLQRATLVILLTRVKSVIPTRDTQVNLISGVFAHIKTDSGVSLNRSAFVIRVARTTDVLGGTANHDLVLFSRLNHNASACSNVSVT